MPEPLAKRQPAPTALVIPGRNCQRTIEACLRAAVPLLETGKLAEILFIDDHSSDDSAERAAQFAGVRVLRSPRHGAGAARNAGWRASNCQRIWFVDADCVVEPGALELLARRLDELGAMAVGGSYANHNTGELVAELIHEEMVARHEAMGSRVSFAITANLLCRREILESLSGFDESLRLAQDLDFAYRLLDSGAVLGFDAASRVAHFHETDLTRYCYKQARQGYWRMQLYARHVGRVRGDSYSGPVDYAQPPLALLASLSALCALSAPALLRRLLLGASGASAAGLLLLQAPRTLELVRRTRDPRYLAYAPFGSLRALFRGAGMLVGAVAVARQRAGR